MEQFDHRLIAAGDDYALLVDMFGAPGVVAVRGRAPTVENVCLEVMDQVVTLLRATYPCRLMRYRIEVTIEEGENGFAVTREVVV